MKHILSAIAISCFVGCCALSAEAEHIGDLYRERMPVKVYVGSIVNESGQNQISPEGFKNVLVHSLLKRRSFTFDVVKGASESDIQISVAIKQYRYMERGPLKVNPGLGTMILETAATATHNYTEMDAEFVVTDTRRGEVVWKETINAYVKRPMTPDESIPLVYDKVSRAFLRKCFGKPK